MNITIRKQNRKNLAFKLTPKGAVVLIPQQVEAESQQVSAFITEALGRLPQEEGRAMATDTPNIRQMIDEWSEKLHVKVQRVQIREMHNKWGSISTAGTLTLASDLVELPQDLAEYIVVHELLHLKFPNHYKGWQVSMGMYLPDWRNRECHLQQFIVKRSAC